MKLQLWNTYNICSIYNTVLWYGDYSALSDDECEQVDEFIASLPETHTFSIADDGLQDSHFARDTITGLMADCYEVEVWSEQE